MSMPQPSSVFALQAVAPTISVCMDDKVSANSVTRKAFSASVANRQWMRLISLVRDWTLCSRAAKVSRLPERNSDLTWAGERSHYVECPIMNSM